LQVGEARKAAGSSADAKKHLLLLVKAKETFYGVGIGICF
jgi:hypothetical protein|tara:strand:- start:680 stop:799 length:120 start_codon:yes stop_codon:yes gene_type:complete